MAINIHHTHTAHVEIVYYSEEGICLRCNDYGEMDNIAEQVCEILVKHNFSDAHVADAATGEVLMIIERS